MLEISSQSNCQKCIRQHVTKPEQLWLKQLEVKVSHRIRSSRQLGYFIRAVFLIFSVTFSMWLLPLMSDDGCSPRYFLILDPDQGEKPKPLEPYLFIQGGKISCPFFFFPFNAIALHTFKFICCIFGLRWVFVALSGLSLVAANGGYSLVAACRFLIVVNSLAAEHRL